VDKSGGWKVGLVGWKGGKGMVDKGVREGVDRWVSS
jgi:hypothetical protein